MRNQVLKLKQKITHKNMNSSPQHLQTTPSTRQQSPNPKSICFIQITDIGQSYPKNHTRLFRHTFFGKSNIRSTFHKPFLSTAKGPFAISSTDAQIVTQKSQRLISEEGLNQINSTERGAILQKLSKKLLIDKQLRLLSKDIQDKRSQRKMKRINEINILRNIQRLRRDQRSYLSPMAEQWSHKQGSSVKYEENNSFADVDIFNSDKEQQSRKIKQRMKSKQSRKHIYHILKHKSEAANSLRVKTQPLSPQKQRKRQNYVDSNHFFLDCKAERSEQKWSQLKNMRQTSKNNLSGIQNLTVNSKPLTFFDPYQVISSNCSPSPSLSRQNRAATQTSKGNHKSKKQIYTQILKSLKNNKNGEKCPKGNTFSSESNQFRQLTPWHDNNDDQF